MIDAASIAKVFTVLMGLWAMGFGIGKAVAWIRKIADVA